MNIRPLITILIGCVLMAGHHANARLSEGEPCHDYSLTLPVGYEYASASSCIVSSGLVAVRDQKGKYGFMNTKSEVVVAPIFENAWDFAEGYAVVKKGKKYGYIRPDGQYAIRPMYDDAWDFLAGIAVIEQGGKFGFIDKEGRSIGVADYDEAYPYFEHDFAIVSRDGKWGMIDRTGKALTPLKYDSLGEPDNERVLASQNNRYGYLDYNGKIAIAFDYEEAQGFASGIAKVLKVDDDEYSTINRQGKKVTPKPNFE